MTLPRSLALAASLLLARAQGALGVAGAPRLGVGPVVLAGSALLLLDLPYRLTGAGTGFNPDDVAKVALASVFVAAFEEMLFRGLLLEAMVGWMSAWRAVVGSSVIFTLWHFGAQDLETFPSIFAHGCFFAVMRLRGAPLWGLAAIHAAFDAGVFVVGTRPDPLQRFLFECVGVLLLAAAVWYSAKRPEPSRTSK